MAGTSRGLVVSCAYGTREFSRIRKQVENDIYCGFTSHHIEKTEAGLKGLYPRNNTKIIDYTTGLTTVVLNNFFLLCLFAVFVSVVI